MIETLYGKLLYTDIGQQAAVIECCGVGYKVTVTANTFANLPGTGYNPDGTVSGGDNVRLYTHMSVREDGVELFGFSSPEELETFRMLISVSGIGPKAGISLLSLFTPHSLARAVAADDQKLIARAPGIGLKTAGRIVLELKDKLIKRFPAAQNDSTGEVHAPTGKDQKNSKTADVHSALSSLGYSRSEISAAMKNVDMTADIEVMIKQALSALMKN